MLEKIRNFCIIAHIDHGKSTLADRMLEITGTVDKRKMKEQILDQMDLERERGITIKLQPVNMLYRGYELNLIDTPGHVDFSYEVSRSLAAVEGAVLLVDATQGIQAQTLANLYLAINEDLKIIPVVNKIDLPAADKEQTAAQIIKLLGCRPEEIIYSSGKTGAGVPEILDAIIERVPAPAVLEPASALRALIFDSSYDEYRGVVAFVRVVDGAVARGDKIRLLAAGADSEAIEVGVFKPAYSARERLAAGAIGYITTGYKDVSECRVGDTVVLAHGADAASLHGYSEPKPMVFAGIFPREGNEFEELREAIAKLKLNDASLTFEPEHSPALGLGYRCGFLGILHLEIFQERLKREHGLDIIVTTPSVAYEVFLKNGETVTIRTPQKLPDRETIERIEEPWVKLDIITPKIYVGAIMGLTQDKRGVYLNTEYLEEQKVILHYEVPMVAILTDYYDKIKSVSAGYGSINYEYSGMKPAVVVKMEIMVAEEIIESLTTIVYEDEAYRRGREIVEILKNTLPRQLFVVKLQAVIGGKVLAAERLPALRKDVTAKLYGGDVSRKKKLLEKQKRGKKKMLVAGKGSVDIPNDTFIKLLRR